MSQTILLAVTGLSPAVVTETLWALARERPRTLPDRVRFITTQVGAEAIERHLLSPVSAMSGQSVWEALRAAVKAGPDRLIAEPPLVIGKPNKKTGGIDPLSDIRTPEENALAAGYILEEVRRIVTNPEARLIASIAGGRKTMGALLHAAVSLIGREKDRITHVLVEPPFDTLPGFFFPGQPGPELVDAFQRALSPKKASVFLADVPFVPLRNRFSDLGDLPGSFDGLRRKFSRDLKRDGARPHRLEFDYRRKLLTVDECTIKARVKAMAILHCLLQAQERGVVLGSHGDAIKRFSAWLDRADFIPLGVRPRAPIGGFASTDIGHDLGELRTAMRKAGSTWEIPKRSLVFPPFSIHLAGIAAPSP